MEGDHLNFNLAEYVKNIFLLFRMAITHVRWAIRRYSGGYKNTYTCLVGKTAIITGGNSGLGYATSIMLASRGCRIIIASNMDCEKDKNKIIESTNNPNIITKYVDLASFSSVRKFAEDIKRTEKKIDFLINNAGVGIIKNILSEDGLNNMLQINYYGHFLLTHLLIDQLKAAGSARVVFVTSSAAYYHNMKPHEMYQLPEKQQEISGIQYFNYYKNAKLCVILAANELGKRLSKHGITVNSVDPGICHTQIVQDIHNFQASDAWIFKWLFHFLVFAYGSDGYQAVRNTVYVLTGENIETGETYFRCRPTFKPHKLDDPEFCKIVWEKSESIVGLRSDEKLAL